MKSIIFGSGYGIYVYLPAIYKFSKIIYLNKKYQYNFNKRKNIRKLNDKIIWYNQSHKKISKIDHIFIAKRPKDQLKIINKLEFNKLKIKRLFLEKPISNNPLNSLKLIKYLESKKINFNVGFLFKFTDWYNIFKKNNKVGGKYKILWKIKIKKKNKSWKYNTKDGGGLLRFYGIHLLRFLFDLNGFFFSTEKDFFPEVEIEEVSIFFFKLEDMVSVFFLSFSILLFINNLPCCHD